MSNYYQVGGYDNSTDFSQFTDLLSGQQQVNDDYEVADEVPQDNNNQDQPDYSDVFDKFNDLNDKFEQLYEKYGNLIGQQDDDQAVNFVSQYSQNDNNEPVNWMEVNNDLDNYTEDLGNFHQQLNNIPQQYSGSTAAVRNNNPGNIEFGDFAKKYGAVAGSERKDIPGRYYAKFPDAQSGINAQKALLKSKNYKDLSIEKALNRWITGNPNNPGEYSKKIANMFGNKKISQLSDDELNRLVNEQIKGEDINEARNLGIKQNGGVVVAQTPEEQYTGLNNPFVGIMAFPNEGKNTFRGLDNGRPVLLKDERGKVKVLKGNTDTAEMFGNVLEHRI